LSLGWNVITRAAPSWWHVNLGTTYLNVPLATVHHLYTVARNHILTFTKLTTYSVVKSNFVGIPLGCAPEGEPTDLGSPGKQSLKQRWCWWWYATVVTDWRTYLSTYLRTNLEPSLRLTSYRCLVRNTSEPCWSEVLLHDSDASCITEPQRNKASSCATL